MGRNSYQKRYFIGVESSYGDDSGVPLREIPGDWTITPITENAEISNTADGTVAEVRGREKVAQRSDVTGGGTLYHEELPIWLSMIYGVPTSGQVKDILDASAATNPNSVARYTFDLAVGVERDPPNLSLFEDNGNRMVRVRGLIATNLTLTLNKGAVATYSLTCNGWYPESTPIARTAPEVLGRTPIVVTDQITDVGSTSLVRAVKATTLTLPSGYATESYSDGGFNPNVVIQNKRTFTASVTTNNNADAQTVRALGNTLDTAALKVILNGSSLRSTPEFTRVATLTMNAHLTAENELDLDDNGQQANRFDFASVPDAQKKDLTANLVVRNDAGGII